MKRVFAAALGILLAVLSILPITSYALSVSGQYTVTVYNTEGEGLALKAAPDVNSSRYAMIPENTPLAVDQVSGNGWGHTAYNGYSGWISLRYTQVSGSCQAESPTSGFIAPANYLVSGTKGEGLELRCQPTIESSSFGVIYENTLLTVQAIQGTWAYTYYNGHYGWANMTYLIPWSGSYSYLVSVYDTDQEGLALKAEPMLSSARILMVPEGESLSISEVTPDGWGHTYYNGQSGWVFLQYTKILGDYASDTPEYGWIVPAYYSIYNTEMEGLELRTRPTVKSSTFGPIPEGVHVLVLAVQGAWAFVYDNWHYGWCYLAYLKPVA